MFMPILYPYFKFVLGTLYPAYKTWKALKRKEETTRRRWMKYWVSFGAFQMFEFVSDITLGFILPFYIELKLACIIWLVLGTKLIFDSIVNRELTKREKSIDKWLTKLTKQRDDFVAIIWFVISRYSVKMITTIMSGGLSVLVHSPEQSNPTSPVCSDDEEVEQDKTVQYLEPDFNENTVSMDWSAMSLQGANGTTAVPTVTTATGTKEPRPRPRPSAPMVTRNSARRELVPKIY